MGVIVPSTCLWMGGDKEVNENANNGGNGSFFSRLARYKLLPVLSASNLGDERICILWPTSIMLKCEDAWTRALNSKS